MEALRHCCSADETLSYRWLIAHNSSLAVADAHTACSFIEMDPAGAAGASTCWTIDVNGFHFATSTGTEPSFPYPSLPPPPPLNSKSTSLESSNDSKAKSTALVQGATSLKRILWRYYLSLLVPLRNKAKGLSSAIPKKPARKRRRSRGRISTTSSHSSSSRTGLEWCRSNADVSVSDAILHCKKSYGSL